MISFFFNTMCKYSHKQAGLLLIASVILFLSFALATNTQYQRIYIFGCCCCCDGGSGWQVNELLEILSSANKAHELFMHFSIRFVHPLLLFYSLSFYPYARAHTHVCCTFQIHFNKSTQQNEFYK